MSVEAISHIMRTTISDGIAKLVAMVLADYADPVTGRCWPKIPTLAVQCSQSERTVQRKLKVLEELGILHVEPNRSGDRKGNVYVLHLPGVARPPRGDRRASGVAAKPATGDSLSPVPGLDGCPSDTRTGDSVVTRRVTLESPPIENPPGNPPTGLTPQPPGGGRRSGRKLLRGNGVAAATVPVPPAAVPPRLDGESAERFERLWAAYPEAGRIDADRAAAERYFGEMGAADQDLALRMVSGYVTHLRGLQTRNVPARPKALHTWLRTRRFQNLVPPQGIQAAAAASRVFVAEGTPEWEAWERYERAQGRIPKSATWSDMNRAHGWWFASAAPPAVAA